MRIDRDLYQINEIYLFPTMNQHQMRFWHLVCSALCVNLRIF